MPTTINNAIARRETPEFFEVCEVAYRHDPWIEYGEKELADLLRRFDIDFEYERRFYPIVYDHPTRGRLWGGFTPDFYLPPTELRPSLNVELTFADKGRPTILREQHRANLTRLQVKRTKIELTQRNYGVETILVTHAVFIELRRNPNHLNTLIRGAVTRHWRNRRKQNHRAA